MSKAKIIWKGFNAGELSPRLDGQVSFDKYYSGCKTIKNFLPMVQGTAIKRPGLRYVAETKDSSKDTILVNFDFSTEQSYCLEFGHLYIRFYKDRGQIINLGAPYEISTTYINEELRQLQFEQINDILYIVHPKHFPAMLSRTGHTSWTLANIPFLKEYIPTAAMLTSNFNNFNNAYLVDNMYTTKGYDNNTNVANDWLQLDPGAGNSKNFTRVGLYIAVSPLNAVYDIEYYDGGVWSKVVTGWDLASEQTGWIYKTWAAIGAKSKWRLLKTNGAIAGGDCMAIQWFEAGTPGGWGAGSYPSAISFYEQRLWLGYNQTLWASKSGDFYNMTKGTADSDALEYTIASTQVNKIQWLRSGKGLFIGTAGGEYSVLGSTTGSAITPTNIKITKQSNIGSAYMEPVSIFEDLLYVTRSKRGVVELSTKYLDESLEFQDMIPLSEHLFEKDIISITYQQKPHSIIWCTMADGTLNGFTYKRPEGVAAWHRHNTDGSFECTASIYGKNGNNELWAVVRRNIMGETKKYIEIMEEPLYDFTKTTEIGWDFISTPLLANSNVKNGFLTITTSGVFCFNSQEIWHCIDEANDRWEPVNSVSYNTSWLLTKNNDAPVDTNIDSYTDIKKSLDEVLLSIGGTTVVTGYTLHVPWYWDTSDDTFTPMNAVMPTGGGVKLWKRTSGVGTITRRGGFTYDGLMGKLKDTLYSPNIGGVAIGTAKLMPTKDGIPIFGGTPDDDGLKQTLTLITSNGYKFNFMAFTEVVNPPDNNKPWRGVRLPTSKTIPQFLDQLKSQCVFYANWLVANNFEPHIFMIGSEMVTINKHKTYVVGGAYTDNTGELNFTSIAKWKEIYGTVKGIFNTKGWPDVIVGYSADWSEYNGFKDSDGYWWRPLDELFVYQDAVLLDCYFGITEQRTETYQDYLDGWPTGRDYDYYVTNYNLWKNNNGGTAPITSQEYAAKNLKYWKENLHYNRNPDGSVNSQTAWTAHAKDIHFMEIGCPSIHSGATEPNLFYDPQSAQSGIPKGSTLESNITPQLYYLKSFCELAKTITMPIKSFSIWNIDSRPLTTLLGRGYKFWGDIYRVPFGHWVKYMDSIYVSSVATTEDELFAVDSGISYDGSPISLVSGANHLEGKKVEILADGIRVTPQIVSGGQILLDVPASKIVVGLPYTAILQTMRIELNDNEGTAQGRLKRINQFVARLRRTKQFSYGITPQGSFKEKIFDSMTDGDVEIVFPAGWTREGYITIMDNSPFSLEIIALIPEISIS